MPLNMVSMAIYVTLEGKIPRTPLWAGWEKLMIYAESLELMQALD